MPRISEEAVEAVAKARWEARRTEHMLPFDQVKETPNGADVRAGTVEQVRADLAVDLPAILSGLRRELLGDEAAEAARIAVEETRQDFYILAAPNAIRAALDSIADHQGGSA